MRLGRTPIPLSAWYPWIESYRGAIREVTLSSGADLLDLARIVDALQDREKYFTDPAHLSLPGSQLVAEELAKHLQGALAPSADGSLPPLDGWVPTGRPAFGAPQGDRPE